MLYVDVVVRFCLFNPPCSLFIFRQFHGYRSKYQGYLGHCMDSQEWNFYSAVYQRQDCSIHIKGWGHLKSGEIRC